jgi:hypothetical protein
MAVTGAAIVLSTLPGISAPLRRDLAFALRTKTIRKGEALAEVGPIFASSTASCGSLSGTSNVRHPLCVRAARKS